MSEFRPKQLINFISIRSIFPLLHFRINERNCFLLSTHTYILSSHTFRISFPAWDQVFLVHYTSSINTLSCAEQIAACKLPLRCVCHLPVLLIFTRHEATSFEKIEYPELGTLWKGIASKSVPNSVQETEHSRF